jgi:excinuclease ABC subunit C
MTDTQREKLKTLPLDPGVYFHRDAKGKIIYIGKAANLKNRVMSYFRSQKDRDVKTQLLVADIVSTDWIVVANEVEALFLESELIKRYKPMYNIDLRDDKNWNYVRVSADEFPVIGFVRRPADDRARYYGPYTDGGALKRAMAMLRKVFPYVTHAVWPSRGCLQYHLGLCPGPEEGAITAADYRRTVRRLEMYLRGEQTKLMDGLERDMGRAAKAKRFEAAARLRDQLRDLKSFARQKVFGDVEAFDLTLDAALTGLAERLGLPQPPRRIEGYDISHLGGTDNVASMVVFTDGLPHRDMYRKFKLRAPGNDDYEHMREVMRRRFSGTNLRDWPKPDLLLIDGGRGQLEAAQGVLRELGVTVPSMGLAKRLEEIIQQPEPGRFTSIVLPPSSHVIQLLQRVRDEAHRFAITYQTVLRGKRATASVLDSIPGVGPATRTRLVKQFGSVHGVRAASLDELTAAVGAAKAKVIRAALGDTPPVIQGETPLVPNAPEATSTV